MNGLIMHQRFLLAALDQASLGRGLCAPNPSVGAVAVHEGKIIAQSWHRGAGTPHAEQLLLAQLPKNISEITLYVTLEPCNHWGKTPPCVDAIINYGIKRVVFAYRDPNPLVSNNNTPRLLSEKGIEVLHYPLAEIDAFYQSYRHWLLTQKPWVTMKIAHSLDGKIAGPNAERVQLSNALCAEFTHQLRLKSDIILTSARTVNQDNPLMNARVSGDLIPKTVAIIDSHGCLRKDAKILSTAKHCHIFYDQTQAPPQKHPKCTYHPIQAIHGLLDLEAIILHLGDLGYHDVFVEVGGTLFSGFHQAHLVNKTYLYIVPRVLGDSALSLYHYPDLFNQAYKISWQAMGDNMIACIDWASEP
jgi:diaminohydroxyphosphoribosylaminopyrimidine deaminase/5-amino-6-(5-phosphoribosylamino)uracil reductase